MADQPKGLPANAYKPLNKGEKYIPFIPADQSVPEITVRSVVTGVIMAALFTFATAYSGLKAGQVFEAAIPIAILAVGLGKVFARKNTILENVIIQSIGAASGAVVAGAIFTLPALYMLNLNPKFSTIFFAAFLGGVIGVLFLIPLRRYFVADQHGLLPFPEATATTEILVSGESAGNQAKTLITGVCVGGIVDFLSDTLHIWGVHFNSTMLGSALQKFTAKTKMVFKMETTAFFVGLGYIVGLKYAAVIAGGSFLAWFVLVPLFGHAQLIAGAHMTAMDPAMIFANYVRPVGIGAIAAAGLMGIVKNSKIIASSFSVGFKQIFGHHESSGSERTDRDISMKSVITLLGVSLIFTFIFFYVITGTFGYGFLTLVITFVISFLFTTVAARAIAIVGTNPVSGMTLVTLIIGSVILVKAGLSGDAGMTIALVMGSVVCTALSVAGAFITDLKIGYWIGSTPMQQERFKFLGMLVAAASVGLVMYVLNTGFGFTVLDAAGKAIPNPALPAPQANVMKTIIITLMDPKANIPWILYGIGCIVALLMDMLGVPALAFALGMYLPQELNTPLLVGGAMAALLKKSSDDEKVSNARFQKGTLIASGLLAGSALFGVLGAVLASIGTGTVVNGKTVSVLEWLHEAMGLGPHRHYVIMQNASGATIIGLVVMALICVYLYFSAKNADREL
ncbi:MAG: oligopeptide transporter, OPT family [Acidobacteria bacterium]|nr:oligopeptide transporter, OPT family [Acidobacteriota bacterium]